MIKRILSIAGKPGLYSLVSNGKNMLIVENIETHKRMPAYATDKVMSLADIAIYTNGEDMPLYDVLEKISEKNDGKPVDLKALSENEKLRDFFGEMLPEYDRERVHIGDMRKVLQWYNLLVSNGVTKFKDDEIAEDEAAEAADSGTADAAAAYEAEKEAEK